VFGNGNSYADTGYQASWEAGNRRILVFYSGGNVSNGMSTQSPYATINQPGVAADVNRTLQQVAPVYPGLPGKWNGRATQTLAHKSPLSNASYLVGQYTAFAGYEAVTEGGVLFCGEHTSIHFQGLHGRRCRTGPASRPRAGSPHPGPRRRRLPRNLAVEGWRAVKSLDSSVLRFNP
jgi:monoamine oxidase